MQEGNREIKSAWAVWASHWVSENWEEKKTSNPRHQILFPATHFLGFGQHGHRLASMVENFIQPKKRIFNTRIHHFFGGGGGGLKLQVTVVDFFWDINSWKNELILPMERMEKGMNCIS